jgi:hypothetical protein
MLAAVQTSELLRRADELVEAVNDATSAGDEDGPAQHAATASVPAVASATRALTSLLLAARSASEASVEGTQTFASVPAASAGECARVLVELVRSGRTQRPGILLAPLPGEAAGAAAAAKTALDAALALLLIAATPGIDARLVSEDALAAVLGLLRLHLTSHVLPAFDPLDEAWGRAGGVAAGGGALASDKKAAASKPRVKKSTKKQALLDEDDDNADDDDGGAAAAAAWESGADGDAGDLDRTAPEKSKITKAVLAAAQARVRPIIVALCEVLSQLTSVLAVVKLSDTLVRPLVSSET